MVGIRKAMIERANGGRNILITGNSRNFWIPNRIPGSLFMNIQLPKI
jgi:hypothetical protein